MTKLRPRGLDKLKFILTEIESLVFNKALFFTLTKFFKQMPTEIFTTTMMPKSKKEQKHSVTGPQLSEFYL